MQHELNVGQCLAVARDVANCAARSIRTYYDTELDVQIKGDDERNLVTEADVAADRLITRQLHAAFPDYAFFTEETYQPGQRIDPHVPTWIVDPLDGTSNFSHRLPMFTVSIGLWWHGRPHVGVVRDVMRDLTFSASRSGGARLNGQQIRVTTHASIRGGIFGADWTREPARRKAALETFESVGMDAHTMRSLGCASLGFCAVAAGWLEGYFNLGLWPWDVAAGALIVEEAGGTFTDESGAPWAPDSRGAVVANSAVHPTLLASVQEHLPA